MNRKLESAYNVAIKYGFCGDCNKTYGKCNGYDCYENAVKPIRDLIDKSDKYRWHDLMENPDDLPNDDYVQCEIVLKRKYSDYKQYSHGRYTEISDGKYWNDDTYGWISHPKYVSGKGGDSSWEVIKWRYIEPSEDEE